MCGNGGRQRQVCCSSSVPCCGLSNTCRPSGATWPSPIPTRAGWSSLWGFRSTRANGAGLGARTSGWTSHRWSGSWCTKRGGGCPPIRSGGAQPTCNITGADNTILPSSLRPGGASHFFEVWDENIPKLQWCGRWACTKTLEHYVQELLVHKMLMHITGHQRIRIEGLAALWAELLDDVVAGPLRGKR